jgi:hypothetical protein
MNFKDFHTRHPNFVNTVKFTVFALLITVSIWLVGVKVNVTYGTQIASRFTQELRKVPLPAATGQQGDGDAADRLLAQQAAQAGGRAEFHLAVMEYFYSRYYMAIITSAMCGAIAAGFLFLISSKGWANSNPYLKTFFLVTTANAAFYASLSPLLQLAQNATDNRDLYLQYVGLRYEIADYLATDEDAEGKPRSRKAEVHYVSKRLSELNRIPIGFDGTKMPDFASAFGKPK